MLLTSGSFAISSDISTFKVSVVSNRSEDTHSSAAEPSVPSSLINFAVFPRMASVPVLPFSLV